MARLDSELLRKIAGWETNGLPVTSLHLDVDGRRWPKRAGYIRRAQDLTDRVCREAEAMGKEEGTGRAVAGMGETLSALEANRAEALVVLAGLRATGVRCTSCGHLDTGGKRCAVCRSPVEEVPDLVEVAVEEALRRRCRVEAVEASADLERLGGIGALLRF